MPDLYYYQRTDGSFPHTDADQFYKDWDAGRIVSVWCEKHGWYSPIPFGCMGCAHEEPEPGVDWVDDDPPWGQEPVSEEEEQRRRDEWDRYYDGQDLPE